MKRKQGESAAINPRSNSLSGTVSSIEQSSRNSDLGLSAWKRMDTSLTAKLTPTIKLHLERRERVLHLMPFFKRPLPPWCPWPPPPRPSLSPRCGARERNRRNSRPHCVITTTVQLHLRNVSAHLCAPRTVHWKIVDHRSFRDNTSSCETAISHTRNWCCLPSHIISIFF